MIYKDAVSNPCAIATWNDVIHSKQVWVSGYEFPRDDGIMPTLTVNIEIMWTSSGIAQKWLDLQPGMSLRACITSGWSTNANTSR